MQQKYKDKKKYEKPCLRIKMRSTNQRQTNDQFMREEKSRQEDLSHAYTTFHMTNKNTYEENDRNQVNQRLTER